MTRVGPNLIIAAGGMRFTLKRVMRSTKLATSAILAVARWGQRGRCLGLLVLLGLVAGPAAKAAEPLKKLVRQYALTSANDFPQRDPQDWRLLGSNDGGQTWVTLDTRKGELFRERQQRRVFQINAAAGYNAYRLQIDLVRDPRVANCVQLAEIELLGATEADLDPVPVFTDAMSAQGDNPPSETVTKLFDGRVETKWLDNKPRDRSTCASWVQWQYSAPSETVVTNIGQLLTLRARAKDGYQVQVNAAMVVGPSGRPGEWSVADATGCLEISGLNGQETLQSGQTISFSGVSEWNDKQPTVRDGRIRITSPASAPASISLEQPLEAQEKLKWVELEGEVRYRQLGRATSFDLQTAGGSVRVYWRGRKDLLHVPAPGTWVVARGICRGAFNEQGLWVAAQLWAAGADAVMQVGAERGKSVAPKSGGGTPVSTLTKIDQIRRLSAEQLRSRPQVKIRGVITELVGAFMQDDTAGIEVAFQGNESRKVTEPGTYIEVEGWGGLGDAGNPVVSADRVTVLGKGKWPEPQPMSLSQLVNGRMDAQWIEMEGVVRSTDGAHLLLICYGREVTASLTAGAAELVKGLVDAAVRVRGVGVTALDDRGRIQGMHLLIPSLEHVEVVEAPADPAQLPVRPIGTLLGLSGPRESYHRVKVEGVVTLQENRKLFLQDSSGAGMAVFKEDVVLDARFGRSRWLFWRTAQTNTVAKSEQTFAPGDRVQVVGFPETRGYSPVLTEVAVTKVGGPDEVKPYEATVNGINDGRADSSLVLLAGVVQGLNTIGGHHVIALEWNDRILQVFTPAVEGQALKIEPGSKLRITGICQVDSAPYAELGQRVAAVRIMTRNAADLVVLARPPWWNMRRALTVMGGMAFVLLAALVWITQLRRQVEERSAQLATEIQLREQTERQRALEQERARIAKDLHDDLGANLAQIVFLSQRVDGAQGDRQELDRWFRLIPATARKTIQSLDEIVWAINPRHDSVESLANYLSQFAQEHLNLAGVRCSLDVPLVLPEIPVSAEVRHNLVLAAREAINNVTSHAAATAVRVTLTLDEAALTVAVADNGRGFDASRPHSEGNGLSNIRRRLEDIGGGVELVATSGHGTTVRLIVPRGHLHGRVIGGSNPAASS